MELPIFPVDDDDEGTSGPKEEGHKDLDLKLVRELEENERLVQLWNQIESAHVRPLPESKLVIKVRNRHLKDANSVYECNAWDDVEWDDDQKRHARDAVDKNAVVKMNSEDADGLEKDAMKFWDKFYGVHQNKFFKDRNWLFVEFPELKSPFGTSVSMEESCEGIERRRKGETYPGEHSQFKVLEIGCGAGNTVFPFLAANNHPDTYVYCCDFSPSAVNIVKTHEKFEEKRCTPFVLDISEENPSTPFKYGAIDVITIIFVMSAINPDKFDIVIKNLLQFLKPGGIVLFRDYGRYDMAQLRFKEGRCISENFYMRGDGTRVYFFTEDEVDSIFSKHGFIKERLIVDKRLQVNRSRQLKMYRVWIQAKFTKPMT